MYNSVYSWIGCDIWCLSQFGTMNWNITSKQRDTKWLSIFTLLLPMLNMALLYSIRIRRLWWRLNKALIFQWLYSFTKFASRFNILDSITLVLPRTSVKCLTLLTCKQAFVFCHQALSFAFLFPHCDKKNVWFQINLINDLCQKMPGRHIVAWEPPSTDMCFKFVFGSPSC